MILNHQQRFARQRRDDRVSVPFIQIASAPDCACGLDWKAASKNPIRRTRRCSLRKEDRSSIRWFAASSAAAVRLADCFPPTAAGADRCARGAGRASKRTFAPLRVPAQRNPSNFRQTGSRRRITSVSAKFERPRPGLARRRGDGSIRAGFPRLKSGVLRRNRERRDDVDVFAAYVECSRLVVRMLSPGHVAIQQPYHRRGLFQDVLRVVEDQEHLPIGDVVNQRVAGGGAGADRVRRMRPPSCVRQGSRRAGGERSTKNVPPGTHVRCAEAAANASVVFPIPPIPVNVMTRLSSNRRPMV